jgi:hypothetical protein
MLRLEAGEDVLDKGKVGIRSAVLDQDEGLALRVDARPVEGVAGYDADVGGEVLLESCNLWGFAGGLTANDGADLGSWSC